MPFPRSDLGERTGAGIVCRDGRRIKGAHRTPGAGHAAARPTYPAELQARDSGATKQPEDGDWLMYRCTYDGWGYSPLSQITAENVGKLKPVWTLATGQIEGHQAPPIVNNGVMFVATPGNQVLALDAKAGSLLWRYKRPIPEDEMFLHPTSRSVGLLGDRVYFAAADAVLVALDAKTRKEVWTAKVEDYARLLYDFGAARRGRQGDGRRLGRRTRYSRLCRRVRCRDRQAQPSGHRQWRPVDGRPAPGRQSFHVLDDCPRRRNR